MKKITGSILTILAGFAAAHVFDGTALASDTAVVSIQPADAPPVIVHKAVLVHLPEDVPPVKTQGQYAQELRDAFAASPSDIVWLMDEYGELKGDEKATMLQAARVFAKELIGKADVPNLFMLDQYLLADGLKCLHLRLDGAWDDHTIHALLGEFQKNDPAGAKKFHDATEKFKNRFLGKNANIPALNKDERQVFIDQLARWTNTPSLETAARGDKKRATPRASRYPAGKILSAN